MSTRSGNGARGNTAASAGQQGELDPGFRLPMLAAMAGPHAIPVAVTLAADLAA